MVRKTVEKEMVINEKTMSKLRFSLAVYSAVDRVEKKAKNHLFVRSIKTWASLFVAWLQAGA